MGKVCAKYMAPSIQASIKANRENEVGRGGRGARQSDGLLAAITGGDGLKGFIIGKIFGADKNSSPVNSGKNFAYSRM